MDKRWIGILIILIIGLSAMYLIVVNTTSVGNAVAVVGDVSVTLPPSFKTGATHVKDTSMYNPDNNKTIFVNFIGKGDNALKYYKGNLSSMKRDSNINILDNSTKNNTGIIHYENYKSKYGNPNEALVFFEKDNRTLSIKLLRYDDFKDQDKDIEFIIENIKLDYKQHKNSDEYQQFTI